MVDVREYNDRNGRSRCYAVWFNQPERTGRGQGGDSSDTLGARQHLERKGVGSGVFECKIDYGPGYRVYFGKDGDRLVILLGGGTKKRQQQDIETALATFPLKILKAASA